MKASTGWLSRKRRREAAYRRGYEAGLSAAKASCEPIAYLRHGEKTFVQNVPFGAMWISDKDDPRAFPVYATPPALEAALSAAEPVAVYKGNGLIDCGDIGHHNVELLKLIPANTPLYMSVAPSLSRSAQIGAIRNWSDQKYGEPFSLSACNDLLSALSAQVQDVAESKPLGLKITKEWFEKRTALEGDHEIGTGRRKLTASIDPTPEELAELFRLAHRIPEGWQLVPKEPTQEMIGAGILAYDGKCENSYRAMLAAAPAKQEG